MNNHFFQHSELTTTPTISSDFFSDLEVGTDVLVRFQESQRALIVSATSTKTVRDRIDLIDQRYQEDIKLLGSVVYWQKKTIDYQALYSAFLLESISEEDFEKEAEKFARHQRHVESAHIAAMAERLDSLIGLKLDTSDYADYFQCSQQNVMDAFLQISNPHFQALLPNSSLDSEE